jgi:hypothetical protein
VASDENNIEGSNQTANNSELWRFRGLDLHTGAGVFRAGALDDMRKLDRSKLSLSHPGVSNCPKYGSLLFEAAVVQHFAIKCL